MSNVSYSYKTSLAENLQVLFRTGDKRISNVPKDTKQYEEYY